MKYRKAIFAVVYSVNGKKVKYLILKRKLHWNGWEFVKGARKRFETRKSAVKREVFEETGLEVEKSDIKKMNFKGKYSYSKVLRDRPGFDGQSFSLYAVRVGKKGVKISKKEHSDHKWVDFEKGLKMLRWANQKKSLKLVDKWLEENIY